MAGYCSVKALCEYLDSFWLELFLFVVTHTYHFCVKNTVRIYYDPALYQITAAGWSDFMRLVLCQYFLDCHKFSKGLKAEYVVFLHVVSMTARNKVLVETFLSGTRKKNRLLGAWAAWVPLWYTSNPCFCNFSWQHTEFPVISFYVTRIFTCWSTYSAVLLWCKEPVWELWVVSGDHVPIFLQITSPVLMPGFFNCNFGVFFVGPLTGHSLLSSVIINNPLGL